MKKIAEHIKKRKQAKEELRKYGSLEVTWSRFDCGLSDDGLQNACENCKVCKYNNFLDYATSVGIGQIQHDNFIDKYIKIVYVSDPKKEE